MKKIALVHDFLVRYGGAEALVYEWSKMYPDAPIYTLFYDEEKMGQWFPKHRVKTSFLQFWYRLFKRYKWMFPCMPFAIESFDLSSYDVILSSSSAFSHSVLTSPYQTHISYIHSPLRWAHDSFFSFQKGHRLGFFSKILFHFFMKRIRMFDVLSSSRPDVLLSASTETQKRIKKYWGKESEVVYPFCDTDLFVLPEKEREIQNFWGKNQAMPYFCIVSQLVPYKRIDLAVKVCTKNNWHLKIIGEGGERAYLESIAGETVSFLGRKDSKDIVPILQNAQAFLFLGVDDFGITPVEAQACGVPVVAYKKGGVLETVEEGKTGVFFEEQTEDALEAVIKKTDFSKFSKNTLRENALRFSREVFVKKIRQKVEPQVGLEPTTVRLQGGCSTN